jgi:hypothetical protein
MRTYHCVELGSPLDGHGCGNRCEGGQILVARCGLRGTYMSVVLVAGRSLCLEDGWQWKLESWKASGERGATEQETVRFVVEAEEKERAGKGLSFVSRVGGRVREVCALR